ncbi:LamG-like jellyroll fold domain-containing protein [Methyloglobulus sp.]|uniref:LamG-like jellyroll fold domain-containing protein n=1 Tax=Methyloglobulus sp. TaxID=2518622 RepID=UPI0032B75DA6
MNTFFAYKFNPFYGYLNRLLLIGFSLFFFSSQVFAGNLNFAWDASKSPNVGGYKLSYGERSKNYTSTIDVGNKTTYQATGLTPGTKYFFAVKAYASSARTTESSYSNEVSATAPAISTLSADFTASKTSGIAPLVVTFTPATSGTITRWKWDFGDGSTSTAQNSTHTYSVSGTYSVSLTVTGPDGTTKKVKLNSVTVTPVPVPTTTPTPTPNVTPTPKPVTNNTKSGLVAAYSFEEKSGATTADASGNGNHGTVSGAVRSSAGYFGSALKFDGVNDWVTIKDSASLDVSSGITLEAWVNPAVVMNDWTSILMKEQPGNDIYTLYANSDKNKPMAAQWVNGRITTYFGGSNLAPNEWWHLAATYDGRFQRLFVNGVLVSTRVQTGLIKQSNGVLRIGGNSIWGEYFNGLIDEVKIYNRGLSLAEIQQDSKTVASVSSKTQLLVGNSALESFVDHNPQGVAEAVKSTAQKNGVVTAIQFYLDASSTATELVAGIYGDKNGHPGTLLAQGKLSILKSGATNTVSIPAVKLVANTPYWIATLGSKGQINFRIRKASASVPIEASKSGSLKTLPSQWVTGSVFPKDGPMSVYGTGY